jgi:hypothetical protein
MRVCSHCGRPFAIRDLMVTELGIRCLPCVAYLDWADPAAAANRIAVARIVAETPHIDDRAALKEDA